MSGMGLRPKDFYRFHDKVLVGDGCWEWDAGRSGSGYGVFSVGDRPMGAHRVAWELWNGPVPKGLQVCHRCDNPGCVRPDHLFVGTIQDNQRDKAEKGRAGGTRPLGAYPLTHCPHGHLYDAVNTYLPSRGGKKCRTCDREKTRLRRAALRGHE